ncbi:MAG: hypothetical protein GEU77_16710 [Deltaproteobacteria bacterium]|nr:hypothetical protein [Deltaproteobacteria bacterium]
MADYNFTQKFLEELASFEKSVSARDLKSLEEVLAAIVNNPQLAGRVPSFYNPSSPSYLYRSGKLLIHYRVIDPKLVEFLNLFWPRF